MTGNRREFEVISHKLKVILIILLTCIMNKIVFAQQISISAKVNKNKITFDENITLMIDINGKVAFIPDPKLPQLNDFVIVSSKKDEKSVYANGEIMSSRRFNYVLVPKNEGQFVIGPVEVSSGKNVYRTESISVEVLPSKKKREVVSQVHPKTLAGKSRSKGENVFIETSVNKKRVYKNEQITLTFRFLYRINLYGRPEYTPPEKTDFWSEDLPPEKYYDEGYYRVSEFRTAIFPTAAGKLTIGPVTVKYSSVFDFLSGKGQTVLKTEPITIDVLPLPEEKPSYFKGAVGVYNINSEINTNEVEAGKPINYYIKINGKGNIKAIIEPDLGISDDFKVYPAGSSDNIKKDDYTVQGDKTYEYYLIPKKPGNKTIPGINFTYFNSDVEKYITLKTKSFTIMVKPGAVEETNEEYLLNTSSAKEEVKLITKDIRPIKSDANLNTETVLLKNPFMILVISLPFLLLVFARIYSKHHEQVEFNPVYKRDRRAGRLVQKRLKEAKKIMNAGDKNEYCHLIARSILGFIGDKLNIAEMGLTSETLKDILKEKNISEDAQENIINLMDKCDSIKFSPIEPEQGWRIKIYHEAQEIISYLEKQKWLKN